MRSLGLVHVQEAARRLGIRPGVLEGYMVSGIAIYCHFKRVPCFRVAMLPMIREAIMESRDGRPFDLGRKNEPGLRDYGA
jgi:hypothetical protein